LKFLWYARGKLMKEKKMMMMIGLKNKKYIDQILFKYDNLKKY